MHSAQQFIEAFSEDVPSNLYFFIGRPQPWASDITPDTPLDNLDNELRLWEDMVALKRIQASDVCNVVPRRDWTTGKYYDIYRHDYGVSTDLNGVELDSGAPVVRDSLYDANFYVITDTYNVYKCLNNKNSLNVIVPSTVKPTGNSTSSFSTADGYIWKYMYTISPADVLKFVTRDFISVRTITSSVSVGEPYYDQFQVQEDAIPGAIENIRIMAGGTGYSSAPTLLITGNGTGATATAVVNSGAIVKINITSVGSGYSYASISVGGPGTGGILQAVLSPQNGHGSDAIKELGGFFVSMNTKLDADEGSGDFPIEHDYRRIGIIKDPLNFGTSTVATSVTASGTRKLTFDVGGTGEYEVDEIVTGSSSGVTGRVVNWDSDTRILRFIQTSDEVRGAFIVGETVTGSTSAAAYVIATSGLGNPEIAPYSGDFLYVENRLPISRAVDQSENISIVVEF